MTFTRRRSLQALSGLGTLAALSPTHGLAADTSAEIPGKSGLRVLNSRPLNAETPAHLLEDTTTPTHRLFVRNNGLLPADMAAEGWQLRIEGESCVRPTVFTLAQLRSQFEVVSYDLQLECGGNGRSEFRPRASGNQWTTGAIGCPRWTGVRLRDVLNFCGVKTDAVYVGFLGADRHVSGEPGKAVISRGVPLAKALEAESLIAFELNGEPIPALHGAPLRLVCGGYPGSVSGKWLTHLLVRNQVHDGAKMGGTSYRVPCNPVAPGAEVPVQDMCIIESMPVKSLITSPESGTALSVNQPVVFKGHAWAGDRAVGSVHTSVDFGATWHKAELAAPVNRLAWQSWQSAHTFPKSGYYEVWARATDEAGVSQPMLLPGWNPKGYLNNACHRVALAVT